MCFAMCENEIEHTNNVHECLPVSHLNLCTMYETPSQAEYCNRAIFIANRFSFCWASAPKSVLFLRYLIDLRLFFFIKYRKLVVLKRTVIFCLCEFVCEFWWLILFQTGLIHSFILLSELWLLSLVWKPSWLLLRLLVFSPLWAWALSLSSDYRLSMVSWAFVWELQV